MSREVVKNLRTDISGNKPSLDVIQDGEIAVRYLDGDESLMIRNTANEIVEFKPSEYYDKIITENEEVIAQALNDLNERVNDTDSIANEANNTAKAASELATSLSESVETVKTDLSGVTDRVEVVEDKFNNPYFKTFATTAEYETALSNNELTYPCVISVEETGKIFYVLPPVQANAIVRLNELTTFYKSVMGTNGYPMAAADAFEIFELDGVNYLTSGNRETVGQLGYDILVFPEGDVEGSTHEVKFKLKETPVHLFEVESDTNTVTAFLFCCDYLEIDESFYGRVMVSGNTELPLYGQSSASDNYTVKFKGDFVYTNENLSMFINELYVLIYMRVIGLSLTTPITITVQIPKGNATYGNTTDMYDPDTGTGNTFCGNLNYNKKNWIEDSFTELESLTITLEEY